MTISLLSSLETSMELLYLPNELISRIISFLNGRDLLELSAVNHQFNKLCNCHTTWYNILKQYKISEPSFYDFTLESINSMSWLSLKSLYINVLGKWGWLVGTWKRHIPAFGGLLFVKLEMSPCRVIGYDVQGIELEMNLVPMFAINIVKNEPDSDIYGNLNYVSDDRISCILYSKTEHNVTIERNVENPDEIKMCCLKGDSTQDHDKEQMISDFAEAVGMNHAEIPNAIFTGFKNGGITFSKINMPLVSCDVKLVEPGFFAGDYSAHGTEILLLKYGSNSILFEKISGDKNVRCGAVSIDIDMTCPVDYLKVLKFIAKQPCEFNIKNIIEQFPMKEDCWLEDQNKSCSLNVDKGLVQALKFMYPERTFGLDESDNSFIAAFKGKITLGMMTEAVIPDYFYYEVLAVITNENSLCIFWPRLESLVGIHTIIEMPIKRLY